jgi:hypothetical protein
MPSKNKRELCPQKYAGEADTHCRLDPSQAGEDFWYYARKWLERAWKAPRKNTEFRYFDAMIYLWVAFNAWLGETATNRDMAEHDKNLVKSAALDAALSNRFECLNRDDVRFSKTVGKFASLWPVFNTRQLHELNLPRWEESRKLEEMSCQEIASSRKNYVQQCLADADSKGHCKMKLGPWCFREHQEWGNAPDWAHTVAAIYQVRCNLFHGGKMAVYSGDRLFVELAYLILWEVWGEQHVGTRADRG